MLTRCKNHKTYRIKMIKSNGVFVVVMMTAYYTDNTTTTTVVVVVGLLCCCVRVCDQSISVYLPAEIIDDIVSQMSISML